MNSKKSFIFTGIILALFIAVVFMFGFNQTGTHGKESIPQNKLAASLREVKVSSDKSENNKITAGEIKPIGEFAKVIRVIDGDTIEIEGGEKVRYIGMDTPETVDPRKPVQCFGVEASAKNKELVEGKTVLLEKDISDKDKYGRLLRYVWAGDILINLELVKQGFAYSYTFPPDVKYQDQFIKAQQEAGDAKRGLWKTCSAK